LFSEEQEIKVKNIRNKEIIPKIFSDSILYFIDCYLLFFWLEPKEPKVQDWIFLLKFKIIF
jgi:hypothetical protein